MITILTKDDLMKPPYQLTEQFIRQHKHEMGGKGKPVRFDKDLVEEWLKAWFRNDSKTITGKTEIDLLLSRHKIRQFGDVKWRGGRSAA